MTNVDLPASVVTDEDKLRCASRLQWMIVEAENKRVESAPDTAGSPTWKDFQERVAGPSATICAMRRLVFPDRLRAGEEDDGSYQTLKVEARADKRWDSELDDHPLLIAKAAPPVDIDPYEEFDAYAIVPDPLVYTTVNGTALAIAALPSNVDEYVYKDFGAGHFSGDFTHLSETQCTAKATNSRGGLCFTANEVDDWYNNTDAAGFYWFSNSSNVLYAYIGHRIGGAFGDSDSNNTPSLSTWYYVTYDRSGSTVTCTMRTGSHAGAVHDVLTMDDDGTARRYFQGMSSRNDGGAPVMSYDVRNVDLQESMVIFRRRIEGY